MRNMTSLLLAGVLIPCAMWAAPVRVAILDFQDDTGDRPEAALGGQVQTRMLAHKGADLLAKQLIGQAGFTLVDRRDFLAKLDQVTPVQLADKMQRPAVIQAAQLLRVAAVLSGSLSTFSTARETVTQGGYSADLVRLTVRVTVRALDSIDGSVIAVTDATAEREVRQTDAVKTQIGEEDVIKLMEQALTKVVPTLVEAVDRWQTTTEKIKVRLDVDTTDNPALVEIDGILVGTTPFTGMEVYRGDHALSISRPGYATITKRILLENETKVRVPLLRTDLTADERKAILEKVDMKVFLSNGQPDVLIQTMGN